MRLSPTSAGEGLSDNDPAGTFVRIAEHLSELAGKRLAYLHISEDLAPVAGGRVTPLLRAAFPGTLLVSGGYDEATGHAVVAAGDAELVGFGLPYLANPDLPRRYALAAPLNPPDLERLEVGGAGGYIDYPTLAQQQASGLSLQLLNEKLVDLFHQKWQRLLPESASMLVELAE